MKKILLITFLSFFALISLFLGSLLFVLYFRPDLVINADNLDKLLQRTEILKKWSWDKGELELSHQDWNHFNFKLDFSNLCFLYEHEAADVSSCLEQLRGNLDIIYTVKEGLKVINNDPVLIRSSLTNVKLKKTKEEPEKSPPPDIYGIWQMLWGPLIPDLDLVFSKINIEQEEKKFPLDLSLLKIKKELQLRSLEFKLLGTPRGLDVYGPESYKLPIDNQGLPPLHINQFHLAVGITSKAVDVKANGFFESAPFQVISKVLLPVSDDFSSLEFLRKVALETRGGIKIEEVKKALRTHGKAPYNELPAPLNAMNGDIHLDFHTIKGSTLEEIIVIGNLGIDLKSSDQALVLNLNLNTPLNLKTFKPGIIGVEVHLEKVILQLPKISKTSLPPQFLPDSRFKKKEVEKKEAAQKKTPLSLKLDAVGEHALNLKSDLLDETLRINFNLDISEEGLENGHVRILPLKTTVFKRPIEVKDLLLIFKKNIDPVIDSHIKFILPEYTIFLELEGPMNKPKYAFRSEPPLPQNDIYAVLLFGRPMADLDPDTQGAAGRTNKILSQGVLSLSVLYFLAGSPVEYIGYDPDSNEAQAQIGLDSKTSLRVGTKGSGQNSTGIRRSLGKGWYLDTSVQSSSGASSGNDYGVLLERIIAY